MKKNFFFLFLFSLFFFPFDSFALTFTDCNGVTQNVIDYTTLRDYCYFNYYSSSVTNIAVWGTGTKNACAISRNTQFFYSWDIPGIVAIPDSDYDYYEFNNLEPTYNSTNSGLGRVYVDPSEIRFSVIDLVDYDDTSYTEFTANYTFQDIKTKYNCVDPEPEEPDPEPEEPETGSTISQNDFYVLLVMLSTLIWLLYFKWCFPLTRGRDL